jgi:TRAP-type uncharacterized transport system substrate-binding protein
MAGFLRLHTRWYLREGVAALFFVIAAGIGISIYYSGRSSIRQVFRITGGSPRGVRSQIAHRLAAEAAGSGLRLRVVDSEGSKDALERVERGTIEMALVQGGIERAGHPHVRQLAALHIEPLHLLVRGEIHRAVEENLSNLRGKTVNLSTPGSGTHDLALDVLRFAGLNPRGEDGSGDYLVSTASYEELEARIDGGSLPDAIFAVSDLPSPLCRKLIGKRRYALVSLPFAEAFSIEAFDNDRLEGPGRPARRDEVAKYRIYPTQIPAYTYGVEPPSPPAPVNTFGPRLLVVANEAVSPKVARLVLEAIFSSDFAQYYRPALDPGLLELAPEYPWHPGTEEYRRYNKPLLAGEVIDLLEKGTSLAGAIAGALFFLWQWVRQHNRRRRELGFESYMVKVAAVERQALDLELEPTLDLKELFRLQIELNRLKNEAISRFAEGKLEGEALMSGFLTHVNDARNHLTRLILHERDNLEERAESERRSPSEVWIETVGQPESEVRPEAGDREHEVPPGLTEKRCPRPAEAVPFSTAEACPQPGETSN